MTQLSHSIFPQGVNIPSCCLIILNHFWFEKNVSDQPCARFQPTRITRRLQIWLKGISIMSPKRSLFGHLIADLATPAELNPLHSSVWTKVCSSFSLILPDLQCKYHICSNSQMIWRDILTWLLKRPVNCSFEYLNGLKLYTLKKKTNKQKTGQLASGLWKLSGHDDVMSHIILVYSQ